MSKFIGTRSGLYYYILKSQIHAVTSINFTFYDILREVSVLDDEMEIAGAKSWVNASAQTFCAHDEAVKAWKLFRGIYNVTSRRGVREENYLMDEDR